MATSDDDPEATPPWSDSNAELRLLTDNVPAMILHLDRELYCRFANRRYAEFFGSDGDSLVGKPVREIIGEAAYREVERYFAQVLAGHPVSYQRVVHHRNGEPRHIEAKLVPSLSKQGRVAGCYFLATDISEQKQVEQALYDAVAQLRMFADNVPAMTVSYDANLRCRFVNKRFAEFFGFTVESMLGKHLREVVGEDAYREIERHFVLVLTGVPVTYQRLRKLGNGECRHLEVKLIPHVGDDGKTQGCFAVTADITEHKQAEERIWYVAHYDSLTALPNRLLFNDRLNQAISLAKRDSRELALLYLDLDKFKPVNDDLGHDAGDELLKNVADRIRQQVRESDTAARIGGDEFAVILPDIAGRENVATVADKIIAALAEPFELGSAKRSAAIGVSIGVALYPADGQDREALVKAADSAMYAAKKAGNCFCFR